MASAVRSNIPVEAQFVASIQNSKLTKRQKKLLLGFYEAPHRSITTAVGDGNLAYGTLGLKIGRAIEGHVLELYLNEGEMKPFGCGVLGELSSFRSENNNFHILVMHHELAKAIGKLLAEGWFD